MRDGSKAEKNRRNQLIEKQMDAVEKTREKARERAEKLARRKAALENVTQITDPEAVTEGMKNAELDEQLEIYRSLVEQVPPKSHIPRKAQKIVSLKKAIEIFNSSQNDSSDEDEGSEPEGGISNSTGREEMGGIEPDH